MRLNIINKKRKVILILAVLTLPFLLSCTELQQKKSDLENSQKDSYSDESKQKKAILLVILDEDGSIYDF